MVSPRDAVLSLRRSRRIRARVAQHIAQKVDVAEHCKLQCEHQGSAQSRDAGCNDQRLENMSALRSYGLAAAHVARRKTRTAAARA